MSDELVNKVNDEQYCPDDNQSESDCDRFDLYTEQQAEDDYDYRFEVALVRLLAKQFADIVKLDADTVRENIEAILGQDSGEEFVIPMNRLIVAVSNIYTFIIGMNQFEEMLANVIESVNKEIIFSTEEIKDELKNEMEEYHKSMEVDDTWLFDTSESFDIKLGSLEPDSPASKQIVSLLNNVQAVYTNEELIMSEASMDLIGQVISNFAYFLKAVSKNDSFYHYLISFLEYQRANGGKYISISSK